MYDDSLLPELQPDLVIGLEERNRRNNRRLRHHQLNNDQEEGINRHFHGTAASSAANLRREQQGYNARRFWTRALCLTIPLTILIVMLLFLGMNASDSQWAAILLRILAFALPTFIVIKIICTCWDVARFGRGYDDDEVRRGVGV
jgi:hypothetical protein